MSDNQAPILIAASHYSVSWSHEDGEHTLIKLINFKARNSSIWGTSNYTQATEAFSECKLYRIGFWRHMQSAAQPAQPDSKEEEKKKPLGDAASPSSSSASASQVQQRKDASTYQSLSESSAEACDQMIGNLKQAKEQGVFPCGGILVSFMDRERNAWSRSPCKCLPRLPAMHKTSSVGLQAWWMKQWIEVENQQGANHIFQSTAVGCWSLSRCCHCRQQHITPTLPA